MLQGLSPWSSTLPAADGAWRHPARMLPQGLETEPPRRSPGVPGLYHPIALPGAGFGWSCSLPIPPTQGITYGRCFPPRHRGLWLLCTGADTVQSTPTSSRAPCTLHQGHPQHSTRRSLHGEWVPLHQDFLFPGLGMTGAGSGSLQSRVPTTGNSCVL